jgi:CRP-like cAMP-binding protein
LVTELVEFANKSGGEDNITVVALQVVLDELGHAEAAGLARRVQNRLDALSSVFLFEDLDFSVLTRLLSACEAVHLERDDMLLAEGDLVDSMFIVETGTLTLTRDGELIGELFPGDCTAITTLLHPRSARATVTADERCTLLKLSRDRLRELLLGRPWLGLGLLEKFARRLSADFDRIVDPDRNRESVILDPERL